MLLLHSKAKVNFQFLYDFIRVKIFIEVVTTMGTGASQGVVRLKKFRTTELDLGGERINVTTQT